MVTMWTGLGLLMWSIMAASVVVLPEPVGPVTSTRPRGSSAISGPRPAARPPRTGPPKLSLPEDHARRAARAEDVRPEPADAGHRVGEVRLAVLVELSRGRRARCPRRSPSSRSTVSGARSSRSSPSRHPDHRRRSDLDVQVRALALEQARQPAVELFHDRFGHVVHQASLIAMAAAAPARPLLIVKGAPRLQFQFSSEASWGTTGTIAGPVRPRERPGGRRWCVRPAARTP